MKTLLCKPMKKYLPSIPKNLLGILKLHQYDGFYKMLSILKNKSGCLLADDMGLGKTIQVIAILLYFKSIEKARKTYIIIIVPKRLLNNWSEELKRFAPSLKLHHFTKSNSFDNCCDVILVTYMGLHNNISFFKTLKYSFLIIDEAQRLKNFHVAQRESIKTIKALRKILMTGTLLENNINDLVSLMDFLLNDFYHKFSLEKKSQDNFTTEYLKRLYSAINPYIIRRVKKDILVNLPRKITQNIICELTTYQKEIYVSQGELGLSYKRLYKDNGPEIIRVLKNICNHPIIFHITCENYEANDEEQFDPEYFKEFYECASINQSGKMIVLKEIILNLNPTDKVLIFTHCLVTMDLCKFLLEKELKINVSTLCGRHTLDERKRMVADFQNTSKSNVFILSLKAGGVGLNLPRANIVVHFDLWWNPAVENQASDRVYRIRQEKDCIIYRFITKDTLEPSINECLQKKQNLFDRGINRFNQREISHIIKRNYIKYYAKKTRNLPLPQIK